MNRLILALSNLILIFCTSLEVKSFPFEYLEFASSKFPSFIPLSSHLKALTFESREDAVLWEGTMINLDIAHYILHQKRCSIQVFLTFEHSRSWDPHFGCQKFNVSGKNEIIFRVPQVAYGYYNLVMRTCIGRKDYILMRSVLVTSIQRAFIGRTVDEEFSVQFIDNHGIFLAFWLFISTFSKSKRAWIPLKTLKANKEVEGNVSFAKCLESSYFHPTEVRYQFYAELKGQKMLLLYENAGDSGGVIEEFTPSSHIISIVDYRVNLNASNFVLTFNFSDSKHGNIEMVIPNSIKAPSLYGQTLHQTERWKFEEFWFEGNVQTFDVPFISFICHELDAKKQKRNCAQVPTSLLPLQVHTLQLDVGECFNIECNSNWDYFVGELKVEIILLSTATKKRIYKSVWSHKYSGMFNISRICLKICPKFPMKVEKYHTYGPFLIVLQAKFPKNSKNWTSLACSKEIYLGASHLKEEEFLTWLFGSSPHKKLGTLFQEYNFPPQYPICQ